MDVTFSFAGKERSTKKETGRLHPGLLKFLLWLCLCCPAMLMPELLGYLRFIRLKNYDIDYIKERKGSDRKPWPGVLPVGRVGFFCLGLFFWFVFFVAKTKKK